MLFVTVIESDLFVEWSLCVAYFDDVALARLVDATNFQAVDQNKAQMQLQT